MREPKFIVGDVVTIKSNLKVKMTVSSFDVQNDEVFYQCVWFDAIKAIQREPFIEEMLRKYEPKS